MRIMLCRSSWAAIVLSFALAMPPGVVVQGQAKPAAATNPPPGTNADTGWPRTATLRQRNRRVVSAAGSKAGRTRSTSWRIRRCRIRRPVRPSRPSARSRSRATPRCRSTSASWAWIFSVTEYSFKSLGPDQVKALVADVKALPERERVLDLDRLLAYVADSPLQAKNVEGIKADPPKLFWAPSPAILVNLDGEPIWSPIKDVDLRVRGQHELGPLRAHDEQDPLPAVQRLVAAGDCGRGTVEAGGGAARQLQEAAGRRQLEGRQGGRPGQEAFGQEHAESVRQPGAGRAHRAPGSSQLPGCGRRVTAAVGEQHGKRSVPHGQGRRLLLPCRRSLVQGRKPRRPVDVCHAVPARRLQEDPDRASAVARAGLGAGHVRRRPKPCCWPRFREPRA